MTALSPEPCPDPSHHRTTRAYGFKRYGGFQIANYFVETITVITSIVTAASYAYAAWNWLENIFYVW
jgi:hypothetical protein